MSDLQLGLLAIGAVVIVAVLAYNKWQEFKFRRQADGRLKSSHDDVLMGEAGGAPVEPTVRPEAPRGEERVEPTFNGPDVSAAAAVAAADGPGASALSDSIDFIVAVEAAEDIEGGAIVEAAAAPLAGLSKAVRLEGYSAGAGQWEPLRTGARYTLMRAGLQLVDRRGPVSNEELTMFGAGVQQAAASAGALASVPDRGEAMTRAADLDGFCSNVDILIAVHIVASGTPFPGTKVRALAEASGLALEDDGRFRRRDDEGRVLYELASLEGTPFRADTVGSTAVPGVALELDVPRTPDPARVFEHFRDLAHQLAKVLEGRIVDEKRAAIAPAAFDQILGQIQAVQNSMASRSIPPGGPAALRLFS
jgi:FtsZ-interacting cell division protein ZipA